MDNSDIMYLFAQANRRCGYDEYARFLENTAAIYEAQEVLREDKPKTTSTNGNIPL